MKKVRGRTFRKRRLKIEEYTPCRVKHDDIYMLSKWMCKNGHKPCKKLIPKNFNESGRGLMAGEVINVGDTIISIPKNLLITPKLVLNSYLGPYFEQYCPKATGQEILSIFLMCEQAKGRTSEWHPYISSLPKSYRIPVYFCQHAMTLIPKPIYESVVKQTESVKNSFMFLKHLLKKLKNTYPIFKDIMDFHLFQWAWSSVNTRCIFMKCDKTDCSGSFCSYHLALAPILDLLNHSIHAKVTAGFNKERNRYEIISQNKYKKYSEVFINYGCHDNQKLFLEYGFVIPENCNDHIVLSIDDLILAFDMCGFPSEGFSKKLSFIKDNNLLRNAFYTVDGLSWNLCIILKILISEYDTKLWNSLLHNDDDGETDCKRFLKLKESLLRMKIDQFKIFHSSVNCSEECSSQQSLIYELKSIYTSILIKHLEYI